MAVEHPSTLLRQLAGEFHRLKSTNKSIGGPEGHQRRQHTKGLDELEQAFERLLTHWVSEPGRREAWRAHFHHLAPEPAEPAPPQLPPPLFKGRNELGRTMEIRPAPDAAFDLLVEGHPLRHLGEPLRLSAQRLHALHVEGMAFSEVFDVPEEAQQALDDYFAAPSGEVPWQHAPELFEDGLIDIHFSLTERGQRLVDQRRHHGEGGGTELYL